MNETFKIKIVKWIVNEVKSWIEKLCNIMYTICGGLETECSIWIISTVSLEGISLIRWPACFPFLLLLMSSLSCRKSVHLASIYCMQVCIFDQTLLPNNCFGNPHENVFPHGDTTEAALEWVFSLSIEILCCNIQTSAFSIQGKNVNCYLQWREWLGAFYIGSPQFYSMLPRQGRVHCSYYSTNANVRSWFGTEIAPKQQGLHLSASWKEIKTATWLCGLPSTDAYVGTNICSAFSFNAVHYI